jgi:hypothetical protein
MIMNEKKEVKTDPSDWGTHTLKVPGVYSISQLESMVPGAPKQPQEGVANWEADLNQRRDWRPCLNPRDDEEVVPAEKKEKMSKEEPKRKEAPPIALDQKQAKEEE